MDLETLGNIAMRKIWTVACREYRAMVGTKAFLFGLAMMPILMFGGILAIDLIRKTDQIEDRKIAVIDHTGRLFEVLQAAALQHNAALDATGSAEDAEDELSRGDRYQLEPISASDFNDEDRLHLSDRIRRQDLYAFVEIPEDVVAGRSDPSGEAPAVTFVSTDATLATARRWVDAALNETIFGIRLTEANIDPATVSRAREHVKVRGLSPMRRDASGAVAVEAERDEMTAIFLPMVAMMLMFMVIFMASQPMLESVLEEKSSRIVEVLLGSVSPSQLMWGKLLGTIGGSLTVFAVYFGGALFVARSKGLLHSLPLDMIPWFVLFQILGVLFFASIFLAVGSAVSQLKEAQSLLLPVWMMLMIPMFVWFQIVREPNGPLAVALTFVPPATPSMIVLRMATGAPIPLWQIFLALAVLAVATWLCVTLAGRIFRVGILWQGKTPRFSEMLRWGLGGS